MLSTAEPLGRTDGSERSSPELALVDHAFAVRARERLADPDDTLARLEREIWLNRLASCDSASSEHLARDETWEWWRSLVARWADLRRVAGRGAAFFAAGATVTVLAFATLIGIDGRDVAPPIPPPPAGGEPAPATTPTSAASSTTARSTGVDSTAKAKASKSARAPSRASPKRAAAERGSGERRFAWAPVPGASGYRVEFFRDDARIYSADSSRPQLALPSRWTWKGRTYRLSPGTYRWYVWPVVSGLRRAEATVQAKLVVR